MSIKRFRKQIVTPGLATAKEVGTEIGKTFDTIFPEETQRRRASPQRSRRKPKRRKQRGRRENSLGLVDFGDFGI